MIIAIDGGAATGKTATAKLLSKKINYIHLNSGLLYRGFTYIYNNNNELFFKNKVNKTFLEKSLFEIKGKNLDKIFYNNEDITDFMYSKNITDKINIISNNSEIRNIINKIQKEVVKNKNIVCEGRDIGTVVFPKADYKFFLIANINIRVSRRLAQYSRNNVIIDKEEIKKMIIKRDNNDRNRKYSPLIKASDSIVIDTSKLSIKEQVDYIYNKVK